MVDFDDFAQGSRFAKAIFAMDSERSQGDPTKIYDLQGNVSTTAATSPLPAAPAQPSYFFYIGLGLAIGSSLFIGCSFVIKKRALLNLAHRDMSRRAGQGGHGYLQDWQWWAGTIMMGAGELCNFAAYVFAPAVLVTPLGALSVLVTAVLSSIFLNEKLNILGKVGCTVCLLGSVIIVVHAPPGGDVSNMDDLATQLAQPGFILYAAIILLLSFTIIFYVAPKFGDRTVIVYVLLCSMIGSFVVVCTKGIGLAITESFSGRNQVSNALTWVCLFGLVMFIVINLNYLNKALDLFNTALVTPIYYVFFTLFVMIVSAILYQEFSSISFTDGLGLIVGFLITIIGIFIMQIFREVHMDSQQLWYMLSGSKDSSLFHFQIVQCSNQSNDTNIKDDFDDLDVLDTNPILNTGRGGVNEYIPIYGNQESSRSLPNPQGTSRSSQSIHIVSDSSVRYGTII